MQKKPPYCLITEETESGSSEQTQRSHFISSLEQANIVEVWAENFHEEIQRISTLAKKYNVIAIDTQFPSISEHNQQFNHLSAFDYQKYLKLAKNVNCTSLIQLGLCLADEQGNVPLQKFCWQFNFKFQGDIEEISPSSGFLLKKAGIDFQKFRQSGIGYKTFTHEFIKSGLLLNKKNKWIVFHGGFDFSYLLKLIRNESLPKSVQDFYKSIKIYFPQKIDIKYVLQKDKRFKKCGLSKLADFIECRRIGPQHQAGSDALLTLQCYFKLRLQYGDLFQGASEHDNSIYGIGSMQVQRSGQMRDTQYKSFGNYPLNQFLVSSNYVYYGYDQNMVFCPNSYQHYSPPYYDYSASSFDKNIPQKQESYFGKNIPETQES